MVHRDCEATRKIEVIEQRYCESCDYMAGSIALPHCEYPDNIVSVNMVDGSYVLKFKPQEMRVSLDCGCCREGKWFKKTEYSWQKSVNDAPAVASSTLSKLKQAADNL